MPRPWTLVDSADTTDGKLVLHRRGDRDFMITVDGRVLMTSMFHGSEVDVAVLPCEAVRSRKRAHVLIGGLGLGFTLRAALDVLGSDARVVVAELNSSVVAWCRGEAAVLTDAALSDPRVEVVEGDVTDVIRAAARAGGAARFDAIVLDLYVGPGANADSHPLYGRTTLQHTANALTPGGVFAVWGEAQDNAFERRLRSLGFQCTLHRPKRGSGLRHIVYLSIRPPAGSPSGSHIARKPAKR